MRFNSYWLCECRFECVKTGLTTARFVMSTTCEACAPATASFGCKQAGRCTGASSPTTAVSGRDPHLPRCFHRVQHAQPARSHVFLSIRPRRTYACPPPYQARRHELRCAVSSARNIPSLCLTPVRRRLLCTRMEVRAGVRSDRGPAIRLLEGRRVSGSAGIHEQARDSRHGPGGAVCTHGGADAHARRSATLGVAERKRQRLA